MEGVRLALRSRTAGEGGGGRGCCSPRLSPEPYSPGPWTPPQVRHIGLSECSAAVIRRVHAVVPVAAIEQEYSLFTRDIEVRRPRGAAV